MQISVSNPSFQTTLFIIIFIALIALTSKRDATAHETSPTLTSEFKGLAILMVIFSHIGYFLFSDHRFLFPLSVAGGIGVNIFLFLSGFGLSTSENKSSKTIKDFYTKRLKAIFVPMWTVYLTVVILDAVFLKRHYSSSILTQNLFGFFPNGDINSAVNSPLWYFTLILFYYLIFPIFYRKNHRLLSIFCIFFTTFLTLGLKLPVYPDVLKLYRLHYAAFPLGILFAYLNERGLVKNVSYFFKALLPNKTVRSFMGCICIVLLAAGFGYVSINSGVGGKLIVEQVISLFSVLILLLILLLKNFQSNLLIALGKFSFEIYLIQWPLMYRYDFIYKFSPAYLGTLIYILIFIFLGGLLNKLWKLNYFDLTKREANAVK